MYALTYSRRFKRSLRKFQTSGHITSSIVADLEEVFSAFRAKEDLPRKYHDHMLIGEFAGRRECHIRGDLLLLYQKDDKNRIIDLIDIGSHSQIFG